MAEYDLGRGVSGTRFDSHGATVVSRKKKKIVQNFASGTCCGTKVPEVSKNVKNGKGKEKGVRRQELGGSFERELKSSLTKLSVLVGKGAKKK